MISLLDTGGKETKTYWAVYLNRENKRWWNKFLKPDFQHVQLWSAEQYGPLPTDVLWVRVDPCLEMVDVQVLWSGAPWEIEGSHCQRVTTQAVRGRVREWFHFGPITCVELVKAHVGIRSLFIRTPWQLWKYLSKRPGTVSI